MRIDHSVINTINKQNVINVIREQGPINRAEVSRIVGLSIPTVMRLTDELLKKRLIDEVGLGESTGGKKPLMLQFASDSYYLIGVDIGTTNIKTIIMDMRATVFHRVITPTNVSDEPENIIGRVVETIARAVELMDVPLSRFLGIGLGMPGLLDTVAGRVLFSPDFKWENVDLVTPIKARFGLPVCMANVTRAMAVGEKFFGLAGNARNFMCINLGYGIGSAIFIDGSIYAGGSDSSGELGHMTLEKNGPICSCGNSGCLEALASANAMSKKAAFLIERGEESLIRSLANGDPANINAKIIFDAAKQGDSLAKEIVREAIEYIGIAIANVVNFLDPELIILEGGVAKSGDILINGLKKVVERRQMKYAGRKLQIVASRLEDDAAAIGAASILIAELIDSGGDVAKVGTFHGA